MPLPWKKNAKPKKASLPTLLPDEPEGTVILTPRSSASSSRSASLQSAEQYSIGTPEWLLSSRADFEEKWTTVTRSPGSTAIAQYTVSRKLATGCFGPVVLVQHRGSREYLVLKVLEKRRVVGKNTMEKALLEKKVLESTAFPFIVGFRGSCQDRSNLYIFMDFMGGGDLWGLLRRQRQRPPSRRVLISEIHTQFYVGQVVLALEYLHSLDLVYRDLKPENIFIGSDGYLRLGDFGFTKRVGKDGRLWTFCGTPDYQAPEIILNQSYTKAVDCWALGVLAYEMVTGVTPFYNKTENKSLTYECAVSGKFKDPAYTSSEFRNLIRRLIEVNPTRRLRVEEVKDHAWFSKLNWTELLMKRARAPYVPQLAHAGDTKYCSTEPSDGNNNELHFVVKKDSLVSNAIEEEDPYARYFQNF